MSIKHLRDQKI